MITIENIVNKSQNNIDELLRHNYCGCYHCIRTFETDEILDFTDNGTTALCPNCGVDAIVPGMVNKFFLEKAMERWFTGRSK